MKSEDIKPFQPEEEIIINKELSIFEALLPVVILVGMLAYNIHIFGDAALGGSNQFILIIGAAFAAIIGFRNNVTYAQMLEEVAHNIKSRQEPFSFFSWSELSGTWLISGIIPSMIYYGLQLLSPNIFLAASVVICSTVSLATGSSWSTSATVGIALIGIGQTMGINPGMTAGAVISGAYFGDKISPLSDTTNLASAMAGSTLFDHIKYMLITTIPSILITILIFVVIGINIHTSGTPDISERLSAIDTAFHISPWLFIVPVIVIVMIIKKTEPLVALLIGALLGGVTAIVAQPEIVAKIGGSPTLDFNSAYKGVMLALTTKTSVATTIPELNELFSAKGMEGMLRVLSGLYCVQWYSGV